MNDGDWWESECSTGQCEGTMRKADPTLGSRAVGNDCERMPTVDGQMALDVERD